MLSSKPEPGRIPEIPDRVSEIAAAIAHLLNATRNLCTNSLVEPELRVHQSPLLDISDRFNDASADVTSPTATVQCSNLGAAGARMSHASHQHEVNVRPLSGSGFCRLNVGYVGEGGQSLNIRKDQFSLRKRSRAHENRTFVAQRFAEQPARFSFYVSHSSLAV